MPIRLLENIQCVSVQAKGT